MLSILGSLLGFASSAVPAVTDHFAKKKTVNLNLTRCDLWRNSKKKVWTLIYDFMKLWELIKNMQD